eukprot:14556-Heterococcus_DN1.PRE.1
MCTHKEPGPEEVVEYHDINTKGDDGVDVEAVAVAAAAAAATAAAATAAVMDKGVSPCNG